MRIRGLIAGYPTMQFFYHNENYGFSAGFSYEVQKKADSLLEETSQETVKKNPTENPTENLSDLEKKIIFVLRDNPAYTQKQIAEALSIGYTTVREYIVRLRNKGAICRIGPDKGGYWQVIETKDNSDEIE